MIEKKIALVTGASRGIGEAIALELAKQDAIVVGTATTNRGADYITEYLAGKGKGLLLNVTDSTQIEAVLQQAEEQFGAIAILVNNAGITRDNLLVRMKEEEWDAIIDTNLKSVFRMTRAVLRGMMRARYGRIINIASVVASLGSAGQANYAAAKAGIVGFSKSLAREVGSRNITVNCVAPGFIDTDMTRVLPAEQKEMLLQQIALGRFGKAEDIASAVAFLASPQAGYITGNTLHVNGGMYMN